MKTHIVLLGSLIACCGLFAFSNILQRAQTQLSPEQLATLVAQSGTSSWVQFFLPLAPIAVAYLLLPVFPEHQALLAIPGLILGVGVLLLQFIAAAKRARSLDLPVAFTAARRKANLTLLGSFLVAACFYAFAMSL